MDTESAAYPRGLPGFSRDDYVECLIQAAFVAGECILSHRAEATEQLRRKDDGSPVTAADHDAQALILEALYALTPDIPVVAEEQDHTTRPPPGRTFWLVDPLDGTRDFVSGGDEFSISIGLIIEDVPTLGLIYSPAKDDLFYGEPGRVFRAHAGAVTPLTPRRAGVSEGDTALPRLVTSKREARSIPIRAWLTDQKIASWTSCSSARKFGLLAAGTCDLYVRVGPTCEWDTAAGDALLRQVGGCILTASGDPLTYGKPGFLNSHIVALMPPSVAEDWVRFLRDSDERVGSS